LPSIGDTVLVDVLVAKAGVEGDLALGEGVLERDGSRGCGCGGRLGREGGGAERGEEGDFTEA
jgi:hypothetical protein